MKECKIHSVQLVLAAIVLAAWVGASYAPAQEPTPPYISVGQVDASPGASVIVPVYYTPDPKTSISSFTAEIEFVSNNLLFEDASEGVVNENELKITNSLTTSIPDENGVKRSKLLLSVGLEGKPKKGIEDGLVAYLMFNLSAEAKPFVIKLTPRIVSAEDTQRPPRKVVNLGARPGSVAVLSADVTPEMSCFFFTH